MGWVRFLSFIVALSATFWALKKGPDVVEESSQPLPSGSDPPPLVDASLLDQAVSCPVHVDEAKGVVLLVHGTGVT